MEFVKIPIDIYKLIDFIVIITTNITINVSHKIFTQWLIKNGIVSLHIGHRLECGISSCLLTLEQKTHQKKNQLKSGEES